MELAPGRRRGGGSAGFCPRGDSEACAELQADLVCMGTHGRTGLARMFFGSGAEHVVRTSPIPVLTVPPQYPPRLDRVLVATDFSPPAKEATGWARTLAAACGAEVVLLHVVELDPETLATVPREVLAPAVGEQIRDYLVERATRRLRTVAWEGERMEVRLGAASSGVVQAAQELRVDVVCMGTRGCRGLAHLVLGSTAEYVLRRSHIPVLTCRAG